KRDREKAQSDRDPVTPCRPRCAAAPEPLAERHTGARDRLETRCQTNLQKENDTEEAKEHDGTYGQIQWIGREGVRTANGKQDAAGNREKHEPPHRAPHAGFALRRQKVSAAHEPKRIVESVSALVLVKELIDIEGVEHAHYGCHRKLLC